MKIWVVERRKKGKVNFRPVDSIHSVNKSDAESALREWRMYYDTSYEYRLWAYAPVRKGQ